MTNQKEREMMLMKLGERMKKIRKRLGLTQKEFAQRVPGRLIIPTLGR